MMLSRILGGRVWSFCVMGVVVGGSVLVVFKSTISWD